MAGVMPRSFLVKTAREESLPSRERSGAHSEIAALIASKLHYEAECCESDLLLQHDTEHLSTELNITERSEGTCRTAESLMELDVLHTTGTSISGMMPETEIGSNAEHFTDVTEKSVDLSKERISSMISHRYNGLKIPLSVFTNGYYGPVGPRRTGEDREKSNNYITREIVDMHTHMVGLYKKERGIMEDAGKVAVQRESSPTIEGRRMDINGNQVESSSDRTAQNNEQDRALKTNDRLTDVDVKMEHTVQEESRTNTPSPVRRTDALEKNDQVTDKRKMDDEKRSLGEADSPKSSEYNPWSSVYPGYPPSYPYFPFCFPGFQYPVLPEHFPFRHTAEQSAYAAHRSLYPPLPFPPNIPPYGLPPRSDKLFMLENRNYEKGLDHLKSAFDPVKLASHESSPSPVQKRVDELEKEYNTSSEAKTLKEAEPSKYHCSGCQKCYSTFSGLSKHKQFHCSSEVKKEFSCKHCEKTYVSLGALKMHIRTHTLPCKCKLCGKAFSRPWLLQGHVRTHTGEKPFSCNQCARAFADRSNLRAHLQTHSDVKKYCCKRCSKTFSRMSLLLKHEDSCGFGYST